MLFYFVYKALLFYYFLQHSLMQSLTIIFPHQLFQNHPALAEGRPVLLVEEWLFFNQYNFHKQKLILHRASMQFYKEWLLNKKYEVLYVNAEAEYSDVRRLTTFLAKEKFSEIHFSDVCDDWLMRRLTSSAKKDNIDLVQYSTPYFLNDMDDMNEYFDVKQKYFQTDFYIEQRKQRNILIKDKKPEGGHWSYDAENRKKFPKGESVHAYNLPKDNIFIKEAKEYVEKNFDKNYGNIESPFRNGLFKEGNYPCTFEEAERWLQDFFQYRFNKFGVYEDAMVKDENILYHSMLSPLLNIGLLTPEYVVNEALKAGEKYNIPLNSIEGFVRQIIGWREFIHIVYRREGRRQRTKNHWGFTRKIPSQFWKGTTGIEPVDAVIKKVLQSGYTHHIERLMIMGNFMLLCEFNPDEVYKWFMELFVDAYDWVMVPNVYGLTQFADGGLMATKPYISSSNYLMKMGDFKKGKWQQIWDGLFWRFMHVHRSFVIKNARLGMLLKTFDKMDEAKKQEHLMIANNFLQVLDNG